VQLGWGLQMKMLFAAITVILLSPLGFAESNDSLSKSSLERIAKRVGCEAPVVRGAAKIEFFSKDTVIFACETEKKIFRLFVLDPKNNCGQSFALRDYYSYKIIRPGTLENKEEALRDYGYQPGKPYRENDSHLPVQEPILQICHNEACTMVEQWVCHKKRWLYTIRS
jgi:hypothetical protein